MLRFFSGSVGSKGCGVWGFEDFLSGVEGLGFKVSCSSGVGAARLRVEGSGCRASDFRLGLAGPIGRKETRKPDGSGS